MKKKKLLDQLKDMGLRSKAHFYEEAFSRNIGLFTPDEQSRLENATIAIPGMGGVGGIHLITLVRTGCSRFHLADFDAYEPANINRQYGAKITSFGKSKLDAMIDEAHAINPFLTIEPFPQGITQQNMDAFLDGVQVVIDGLDFFSFDIRRQLFNRALAKGIHVITAGPMGYSAAMLIFSPDKGMRFDEYFNIIEGMTDEEKYLSFALGLSPRPTHIQYMDLNRVSLESKAGPSLSIACQLCAGLAATEAVKIILKKGKIKSAPHYFQFDPYVQKYRKGKLRLGNRHPAQRAKIKLVKKILQQKASAIKPITPESPRYQLKSGQISENVMDHILKAGIQAPSGDNAQPWKFEIEGNRIHIHLDDEADRSFFNFQQMASMISCGAVIENIQTAASMFGLSAKIHPFPLEKDHRLVATVSLEHTDCDSDPLAQMIWHRQTNRRLFKDTAIAQTDQLKMQACVSTYPGIRLHLLMERTQIKKLAKIIFQVDRIRTEHRPLHEHLNKMIRFTPHASLLNKDGLPLENLEAGLMGEVFLKATRPWWVMNIVNKIGMGRMVAMHSLQSIMKSAGAGLITVPGVRAEDFLHGGRALERLWLTCTQLGISFQPMTAITLFWLRWAVEGPGEFSESHRILLSSVWKEYEALFPKVDFEKDGHIMLFRMGYADPPKHGTYRKDLKSFLK